MNKARTILIFTGIFLAGAVVGGVVSLGVAKRRLERGPIVDRFIIRQEERIARELQLTDAQQKGVHEILQRMGADMRRLRRESMQEGEKVMRASHEQILALLNPDQRKKFESIVAEQRTKMRRFREERDQRWRELLRRRGAAGGSTAGPDGGDEPPPPPPPDEPPPEGGADDR